jgi:quinol-cytochrome oxidoreductase complex cytochrome b subunit
MGMPFEHVQFLLAATGQMAAPGIILFLAGVGTATVFRLRGQAAPSPAWMVFGLIGPVAMILWASATYGTARGHAGGLSPSVAIHLILAVASLVLVLGVGWLLRKSPRSWLYVPVALGLIGIIIAAVLIGGMAIANDWI